MVETAGEWRLETTDSGIRSYVHTVKSGNLFRLRAITVVHAPLYVVGAVVRDLPAYPQWMAACKQSRVVEAVDENNFTAHITLAFPVISDRDLVVKAATDIDLTRGRSTVTLSSVKDSGVPIARGIVRMPSFSGSYVFEYLAPDRTGVVYTYAADPGGNIPSMVSNWFSKNLLMDTLKNMKIMVKRPSYIAAAEGANDKRLYDETMKDQEKVRLIIRNRLKEHLRDHESIDALVADIDVGSSFLASSNGIAELLFDASGSPSALRRACQLFLKLCLEGRSDDRRRTDGLAADPALIDTLLNGPRPGQSHAHELIAGHFPPPEPVKKSPTRRSGGKKKPGEVPAPRKAKK